MRFLSTVALGLCIQTAIGWNYSDSPLKTEIDMGVFGFFLCLSVVVIATACRP